MHLRSGKELRTKGQTSEIRTRVRCIWSPNFSQHDLMYRARATRRGIRSRRPMLTTTWLLYSGCSTSSLHAMREKGQITDGHCEPPDGPKRNMSFRDCPSGYVLHIGRDWRDISGRNAGADSAINRSRHRGSEDISTPASGAAGFSCSKFNLSNSHVLAMRRLLLGIPHRWW